MTSVLFPANAVISKGKTLVLSLSRNIGGPKFPTDLRRINLEVVTAESSIFVILLEGIIAVTVIYHSPLKVIGPA